MCDLASILRRCGAWLEASERNPEYHDPRRLPKLREALSDYLAHVAKREYLHPAAAADLLANDYLVGRMHRAILSEQRRRVTRKNKGNKK